MTALVSSKVEPSHSRSSEGPPPKISVIVVVHNMAREAPRTLYSLSPAYQRNIAAEDYEVIVLDNGSDPPLDPAVIESMPGNFRLIRIDPASPSPAHAINCGLAEARGQIIGVMIDGARIVTPGFLHFAYHGAKLYPRAVVVTLGWYLGGDYQRWAMEAGYNQEREDALLASIGWPQDGYRLFEIGAADESSFDGWFARIGESNGLFLGRESWDLLGGVDERFDAPGGGVLNLDTFARAMELPNSELVILLGEASFHQFHGGVATNADHRTFPQALADWWTQYERIRGRPFVTPNPQNRTYLGVLPPAVLPHFARSLVEPARGFPLGLSFDQGLWLTTPLSRPDNPICAALLDLAATEFRERRFAACAAVARLARNHAPDEPGLQRLLANASPWLILTADGQADVHFALGKAHGLLGDKAAAEHEFRAALAADPDHQGAGAELAKLPSGHGLL